MMKALKSIAQFQVAVFQQTSNPEKSKLLPRSKKKYHRL